MTKNLIIKKMIIFLAIVALLLSGNQKVLAGEGTTLGLLPPNARPQGNTLAEWSKELFQTIITTPLPDNPFYGAPTGHCVYQLDGRMALLWTNIFTTEAYTCSVPPGTLLVIPVVGLFADDQPPTPCSSDFMAECVDFLYDIGGLTNLSGSLDGVPLPNLDQYLVDTITGSYTAPADNIFGYAEGTPVHWAAKSVNIIIAPLPSGEHTLQFYAEFPGFELTIDYTLKITVEP